MRIFQMVELEGQLFEHKLIHGGIPYAAKLSLPYANSQLFCRNYLLSKVMLPKKMLLYKLSSWKICNTFR